MFFVMFVFLWNPSSSLSTMTSDYSARGHHWARQVVVVIVSGGVARENMVPWDDVVHLENLGVLLMVHIPLFHPPVQQVHKISIGL
jgi:hypothetical protein